MQPTAHRRGVNTLLLLSLILSALLPVPAQARSAHGTEASMPPAQVRSQIVEGDVMMPPGSDTNQGGLTILLSDGSAQPATAAPSPTVTGTPLDAAAVQTILDRLPPLPAQADDAQDFNLPPETLPAPRPGTTVEESFPPAEDAPPPQTPDSGPLAVLRYAPEGEIPVAPFVNVTFSQPMVPIATQAQLAAADVPITLTPELPGTWQWLGTKTLSFEYAGADLNRFPMATEYTVEVPAGTTSATGGVLAEPVTWTFRTPAPTVVNAWPTYGPQRRDTLMFVEFDQQIDPAAVLATVTVTAQRETFDNVRLATDAEIAQDERISRLVEQAADGRWLVFRTAAELPSDTTVNVAVGPGTPSAEGPLVTERVQSFSFQTYAPLRVVEHRCSYYDRECPPFTPFVIRFNNPLDSAAFTREQVAVTPAIPGMTVNLYGDTLELGGATVGRTTYTVTVDGGLRDTFGQTLGDDAVLTFTTTDAPQLLTGPDGFVTLDPAASTPSLSVYSVNHDELRVRAFAVTPDDFKAFLDFQGRYRYELIMPEPPGKEVWSTTIDVQGETDALTESVIDLSDALGGQFGHLIVMVDDPNMPGLVQRNSPLPQRIVTWVQATQIGLDAFSDSDELVVWATDLGTGAPLADVAVRFSDNDKPVTTNADGLATLQLTQDGAPLLLGERGQDLAILPSNFYYWDEHSWAQRPLRDTLSWYVFDDRGMYRPGETVHVKGWLRQIGAGPQGDVMLPATDGLSVRYQLIDSRGNELGGDVVPVTELAGFDFAIDLPANINLGYATLYLTAQGASDVDGLTYGHGFQVQEFRRPEFEVTAQVEGEGPFFLGESATVTARAAYFAGGPLPNAPADWTVTATPGQYSPPGWPDFIFGQWMPWWGFYGGDQGSASTVTYTGRTDSGGEHLLQMDFVDAEKPQPYSVRADASVTDLNRQVWNASATLLVHPADRYVGLRSARNFVEQGEPLEVDAIVTDVDGAAQSGVEVALRAARLAWEYQGDAWTEVEQDVQECSVTSGADPVRCTFTTEVGGEYRITAEVRDAQDRLNRTEMTLWVSGGARPPQRNVDQEEVILVPDKESYQPGDVAEVLVQAPFAPAEGLLTVARSGILYTERFVTDDGSATLRIPIEDAHIPNLSIQVDLTGSAPRVDDQGQPVDGAPPRPAYAVGRLDLPVPPLNRTLGLTITPQADELEPGASTAVDVALTDAAGAPVADAELAVVVVDEAILALTNYTLADPLAVFYPPRYADVQSTYGRRTIVLDSAQALADKMGELAANSMRESAMGGAADVMMAAPAAMPMEADMAEESMAMAAAAPEPTPTGAAGADEAITVRSNFDPLAVFAPAVRTDADGRATVSFTLPDNLTRYRVMVVAVADGRYFGADDANLTARLPLMVRPSPPRFLNFGDVFELPVLVQNQTDAPLTVDVVAEAANLTLTDMAGQRVTVPANDRVEVRFPATTENAGTARVRVAAVSGAMSDADMRTLPVYTPATTEAFATYGVVDEGAIAQPIATPRDVFPQFGGLEVNTSSTALQALTDAVIYLTDYPFSCSEQLASRVLGIAALRDVLDAFDAEGLPAPEELAAAVQRDIALLQGMQNDDGGFPVWQRGYPSDPFYSVHVAHALVRAQQKGFTVPADTQSRALDFMRSIDSHIPGWYSAKARHAIQAYALYVRSLMNDVDAAEASRLLNSRPLDDQSLEAVAWLWQVLSGNPAYQTDIDAIRRHVDNQVVETAGAANFITSYDDDAYLLLHSNRRTDAVVLDALINDEPESDLIPKVVAGLLAHQVKGRWNNTQENVFVLLALDRYFNTFEAVTPDFVARLWLGDTYVAEHSFQGRTTEQAQTLVPMRYLTDSDQATQDLLLAKEGDGRLYYRLGLRYAPDDLDLDPLDRGFVVQRSYAAVDDPADVTQDEDGVWHIKAGARVRVTVKMVAESRRYHVALVDPLPAGLEIINPALAVAEPVPGAPQEPTPYGFWWYGPWYQHQNLRDQRAEAFTTLLWDGVYSYEYVARATTPGTFVVPPAKAEEMYSPEVFGRSASDVVMVE
ncbi:MAG: hypothetical protein H6644_06960 [Caldilineaceae bacterium]|nr:hypothetical protein [Caldilineaceae bacterium]